MGQFNAARPVVLIRGADYTPAETATSRDLLVKIDRPEVDADLREDRV